VWGINLRTFRKKVLASLVTRLTLAAVAVLVLSLGLTTVAFVVGSRVGDDRQGALRTLQVAEPAIYRQVRLSLLNAGKKVPLALMGSGAALSALGFDRVLLTGWDNGAVADKWPPATPASPSIRAFIPDGAGTAPRGAVKGFRTEDGVEYAYLAVPAPALAARVAGSQSQSYRDIVLLRRVTTLPNLIWSTVGDLAGAGTLAVLVSSAAALLVLRRITKPIHAMTLASERMAAGDYAQRVEGAATADEIGQLAQSFNHMATEVEHAREAQRQFVANVSHDLRSPLTAIIGFSEALRDDVDLPPTSRRSAEIIFNESERMHRLTMDLLDLSRLQEGRLSLSRHPLDLNALLHEAAARYHGLPPRRGVSFVENLSDERLTIVGDPDRLAQIVSNLVDNALKFCDAGGEVRLGSARDGVSALATVHNSGPDLAPQTLALVFDRFYRGDHSRAQQTGGSGIGLAIVRELAVAHGGAVTPWSAPGQGVTMTLRLPLVNGNEPFTEALQNANTTATALAAAGAYSRDVAPLAVSTSPRQEHR